MNLVQSEIEARLRHGMTQIELAAQLGVASSTLNNILMGHREASGKVLTGLGLKRVMQYVYADDARPQMVIPETVKKPRKVFAGKPRRKKVALPYPIDVGKPVDEQLTVARIQVALKLSLNPGKEWMSFTQGLSYSPNGDTDAAWSEHCSAVAAKPDAVLKSLKAAKPKAKRVVSEVSDNASIKPPALNLEHLAAAAPRVSHLPAVPAGVTVLVYPRVYDSPDAIPSIEEREQLAALSR